MTSPYTLYDASVVTGQHILNGLEALLRTAEKHPNSASFPTARLFPDMLPLTAQVYLVTSTLQDLVTKSSGQPGVQLPKGLTSFSDYYERIALVRATLDGADRDVIDGRADASIEMDFGPVKGVPGTVRGWVAGSAVPNAFFHLVTAYGILRKEGVELGKADYLRHFFGDDVPENLKPKAG